MPRLLSYKNGEKMQPTSYKLRNDTILILKQKRTVIRQLKKQLVATGNLKGSMEVLPFFDPKCKKTIEKTIIFLEKQIKGLEEELAAGVGRDAAAEVGGGFLEQIPLGTLNDVPGRLSG